MTPLRPARIRANDPVALVATGGPANAAERTAGLDILSARYRVSALEENFERVGYLSAPDEQRLQALQHALDEKSIRAIVCLRGGFGTSRILDQINLDKFTSRPKWVVGSSDLTALLIRLWADFHVQSIHGPMVSSFSRTNEEDLVQLWSLLEGKRWNAPKGLIPLTTGEAEGPIIGGNLTMLAHMCGSTDWEFANNSILFLEDVGERPYRLDRCLTQLRRSGLLRRVSGVLLGEFTTCEAGSDGITAQAVVQDAIRDLGVPAATGYPAAHGRGNHPFLHGGTSKLEVGKNRVKLQIW